MGLLSPSSTINYDFVAGVYGAFALLSVALFVGQRFTTALDGFYIVVAPFLPCFLWSLAVRQRWLADKKQVADAAAASPQETKKDQ